MAYELFTVLWVFLGFSNVFYRCAIRSVSDCDMRKWSFWKMLCESFFWLLFDRDAFAPLRSVISVRSASNAATIRSWHWPRIPCGYYILVCSWLHFRIRSTQLRINSIMPVLFSLTIYPAKFYLLITHGPSMARSIRTASIINLVFCIFILTW